MADLLTPELRVELEEADYAKIVAEPLEAGFGTTLGNALRRVLLSSLPGAAITSVRIEGVDHEFSTVEHMKEDVTEFLLNLKEVRLRAFSDRPARLFLEASGEGEVTAGEIQSTADYEVVNPDLHLACAGRQGRVDRHRHQRRVRPRLPAGDRERGPADRRDSRRRAVYAGPPRELPRLEHPRRAGHGLRPP